MRGFEVLDEKAKQDKVKDRCPDSHSVRGLEVAN